MTFMQHGWPLSISPSERSWQQQIEALRPFCRKLRPEEPEIPPQSLAGAWMASLRRLVRMVQIDACLGGDAAVILIFLSASVKVSLDGLPGGARAGGDLMTNHADSMLAAVFARPGHLELCRRPIPRPTAPDDVLIEVEGCGICGTDLHILDVPAGHPASTGVILGHEFVGRAVETGPEVRFIQPGDRVAVAPNLSCGRCRYCRAGLVNHCQDFTTLGIFRDGGLAPFSLAPERACHPLSDTLPFEDAVWTEVLSCVANSIDNLRPLPGETAVVIGAGPVGALHALLLQAAKVRVLVTDIQSARLLLLDRLGIDRCINSREEDLLEAVSAMSGWGADLVVDAVGSQLELAIQAARVGGRISLFGMDSQARPSVPQNSITRKELTILGSYVGVNTFPRAIAILESGVIHPSQLISEVVELGQLPEALQALRRGELMKAAVKH